MKKYKKSSKNSKIKVLLSKIDKSKLAFLVASPVAVVITVVSSAILLAGVASAAVLTYRAIITPVADVAHTEQPVSEPEEPVDVVPSDTNATESQGPPPKKDDGTDDYLVWRNCLSPGDGTSYNVVSGEPCEAEGSASVVEDPERANSYGAIRTYLNARGWPEAVITGSPGEYTITATKTVPLGYFNCKSDPTGSSGDEYKLAQYYDLTFGTLMPPSVKERHVILHIPTIYGTITYTWDTKNNISLMDNTYLTSDPETGKTYTWVNKWPASC